jgi:predicted transcriptional regulator
MPRKRRLKIRIFFIKYFHKNENMLGSCTADDYSINNKHFEFTIRIDSELNLETKLSILAHEMTHVKQYATGQLLYDAKNPLISIWEGQRFDDNEIEYDLQPWEIDAVKHEIILLKDFTKTVDWV